MTGWGRLGVLMGLMWLLGGCFQADLTLQFDHRHHGHWTQTLTLGERNLAVAGDALDPWLQHLRDPAQRLGGSLHQTPSTLELTVPFSTPADLVSRFEAVFADPGLAIPDSTQVKGWAEDPPATVLTLPSLGTVPFHLETQEKNWGLASQVRLVYNLDLRHVVAPLAPSDTPSASGEGVFFELQVPWGVPTVAADALPPVSHGTRSLRWKFPLGELNHIDVTFWLPNGIGLGGLAITVLVLLGYGIRYRWLGPPPTSQSRGLQKP